MTRLFTAFLALAAALAMPVQAANFRAPSAPAPTIVELEALPKRVLAPTADASGRMRIGDVRALAKAALLPAWQPVAGGFVSRFTITSTGAEGLRAQLVLGAVPGELEVSVQGAGVVETMPIDPRNGPEAWTPLTDGDTQVIEIYSAVRPSFEAVRVAAVVHQTVSALAKAAGTCTVPINCSTGSTSLDAAIAITKKSMMRILFVEDGGSYVCTATLIDTPRNPTPYVMTANHCVSNAIVSNTITTLWFYENASCDAASTTSRTQVAGGMQMIFGNHNVDSTLLLMNLSAPAGALFAPTNRAEVTTGQSIVSLSHPAGDAARLALGTTTNQYRLEERPQDFNAVQFSRGIIEGGSSGSALFILNGSTLQFRGTLLGTTTRNSANGMSCTDTNEEALYSRFDIFAPEIDQYIGAASVAADDAPNRPQDVLATTTLSPSATTPTQFSQLLSSDGLRIDYAGDMDTFKFRIPFPAVVSAWTEGSTNLDTVGAILDANGSWITSNDDAQTGNNHMGITTALTAGSYYVQVGHFEKDGTGPYNLRVRADMVNQTNFTDLWNTATEPGWGLTVNHQGNTVFATLFTYDASGNPMWLAMSNGIGTCGGFPEIPCAPNDFSGPLYRNTGAAFNGTWQAATATQVGNMKVTFSDPNTASLNYTVNGVTVNKTITRFTFLKSKACNWSAFDRSFSDNYQDLWLSPAEPGWGLNLAHQVSDTGTELIFGALFTYDTNGNGVWLSMSSGSQVSPGKFQGVLYRTTGPAFNAVPWTPAVAAAVGTMTLTFTDGNNATLQYTYNGSTVTKPIQRYVFGSVKPNCAADAD